MKNTQILSIFLFLTLLSNHLNGGIGSDASSDLKGSGDEFYLITFFSETEIFNSPRISGKRLNNNGSMGMIDEPLANLDINLESSTDLDCFGGFEGSIVVAAMGGQEPYQYSLNGGTYGDSPIFDGLAAGTYTVTVQDETGATDMLMVTLSSPPEIIGEILNVTNNVCFGGSDGSIVVTASGGTAANGTYEYSINGSSPQPSGIFNNLLNGFYVISIIDDNLCTTQVTTSISSPDDLDIVIISQSDIYCYGFDDGTISVDAFGGSPEYMYAINDEPFSDDNEFFDLEGGTHIITVMDSEGCTEEVIAFIDDADKIEFDIVTTPTSCYNSEDGIISINNATGGTGTLTFSLNGGDFTNESIFEGLPAGQYFVSVVDSIGCLVDTSTVVASPEELILNVNVEMDVNCAGDNTGIVLLEAENGIGNITYTVDQMVNFTGTFDNLFAGDYTASATDENGCTTEVAFEIQQISTFEISYVFVADVSCHGGSDGLVEIVLADTTGAVQFSIDGINYQDSPEFTDLSVGDYVFIIIDSLGCSQFISMTIEEPPVLEFDYFSFTNVACYGDASGQIEYSITGGNPPYFYTENGNVTSFTPEDTVSFFALEAGEFIVHMCDNSGCELIDTIYISQNDSLVLFVSTLEGDKCGEEDTGAVDLNTAGGYAPLTITINGESNTDGVFDSLAAGNYTAVVEDDLGCMTSLDFNIPELNGLTLDSLSIGNVSCNGYADGFAEIFVGNGNGEIIISQDDILYTSNLVDNLPGGTYNFTATDEVGCSIEIEVDIYEPNPLMIEVVDANLGEGYIEVEAVGGTQPFRYSIDGKVTYQDSTIFTNLEAGDYTLIVIDDNGCESSVVYTLVGLNDSEFQKLNIYPNPVSNTLYVEFEGGYSGVSVDIINRLGQLVKSYHIEEIQNNSKSLELGVKGIARGSYMLRLRQGEKVGYYQIVIVR